MKELDPIVTCTGLFINSFNKVCKKYAINMNIYYTENLGWGIEIWRRKGNEDESIFYVNDDDIGKTFAAAAYELDKWQKEQNNKN